MRLRRLTCLLALSTLALPGWANTLPMFGLYNTGVDNTGQLAPNHAADSHYHFGVYSGGAWLAPTATEYVQSSGYPVGNPWLGYDGLSSWLSYTPGGSAFVGYYHVQTTFDLTGYDLATVHISGRCVADDTHLGVYVNNNTHQAVGDCGPLNAWGSFSLGAGQGLHAGINTLDFYYRNTGYQEGFRAEYTQLSGQTTAAVPEPGTMVLMLAALPLVLRRRPPTKG